MAKMTLEELRALRDTEKAEIENRHRAGKDIRIIVGMGTCGIAAGAKAVFDEFLRELEAHHLQDVSVTQTGCMGLCYVEPTVEVIMPGMPATIYGKVDAGTVKVIVEDHIMQNKLVSDHIFDHPSVDIMKHGGK